MRRARSLASVQARALYVSRAHDDEREDSNDDSVFDAFAEELDSN